MMDLIGFDSHIMAPQPRFPKDAVMSQGYTIAGIVISVMLMMMLGGVPLGSAGTGGG